MAEIDKGVRDILHIQELFLSKQAIMRAFEASKNCVKSKTKYGEDFVEWVEFRFLLIYLF